MLLNTEAANSLVQVRFSKRYFIYLLLSPLIIAKMHLLTPATTLLLTLTVASALPYQTREATDPLSEMMAQKPLHTTALMAGAAWKTSATATAKPTAKSSEQAEL